MEEAVPFAISSPRAERPRSTAVPVAQPVRRLMRLDAEVLFRAGPEIEILQGGEIYRLRRTRANKLILTK